MEECEDAFGPGSVPHWFLGVLENLKAPQWLPGQRPGHDFINPGLPEALRAEKPLGPNPGDGRLLPVPQVAGDV